MKLNKLAGRKSSENQEHIEKQLRERIKELECIQQLNNLAEKYNTIDDIFSELVHILKQGWQFPELTEVRITNKTFTYQTDNFKETKWKMLTEIKSENAIAGTVEIIYLENPTEFPDPFLKQEYSLLQIITGRLGKIIERLDKTKRYEELFNTLYEAVLKADRNGIITEANQTAAQLCGYETPENLIGKPMSVLYPNPEIRDGILEKLNREGGAFHNCELLLKRKDGSNVAVFCNIRMLYNRKGEFVGTLGALRDISEWKKAEEKLLKSKTILQEAEKLSNIGSFEWNIPGKTITVSEGWQRIHGTKKSVLEIEKLMKIAYPGDVAKINQTFDDALSNKTPYHIEHRIIRQNDNETRLIKARGKAIFDEKGKPLKIYGSVEDITDRKQAEQALKESEKKYKALFSTSPDAILLANRRTGIIEAANETAEALFETQLSNIIGKHQSELHPIQQSKKAKQAFKNKPGHENETPNPVEIDIVTSSKTIKTVEIRGKILEIDGEEFVLGTFRDITDRKQAEQALKESEEKYRSLFENSLAAITFFDPDFKLAMLNEANARLLGGKKEDLIGKSIYELFPDVADMHVKRLKKIISSGEAQIFEDAFNLPGGIKWFSSLIQPIYDTKQQFVGIQIMSIDITDRKRAKQALKASEERYKRLVNNSSSLIMEADADSHEVISCNPAMAKAFNTTVAEITGKKLSAFLPPEILKQRIEKGEKALREDKVIAFEDERNGRYLLNNFIPIVNENGRFVQTVTYDITDRKQTEQELIKQAEKLENLNKDKDRFISILAHDIKNPFSTIIGFSELLLSNIEKYDKEKIKRQVIYINNLAVNTFTLLEEILLWKKNTSDNYTLKPHEFNASDAIDNELGVLKSVANNKQIKIYNSAAKDISVYTDETILKTVLRNLISNAIKFTNKDGRIVIEAEEKHEAVQFSVSDTGVGIKQTEIEKLFKLDNITTTAGTNREKGTGLGLKMCKEILCKIGGKIWAESEVGKGSTFFFTIPSAKNIQLN